MSDTIENLIGHIFAFLIVAFFILILPVSFDPNYIYKDLDGNIGYAESCSYSDKTLFSGGQGSMVCKSYREVISVKWYSSNDKEYTSLLSMLIDGGKQ